MKAPSVTAGDWEILGEQGCAIWAGNEIIASMAKSRSCHKQARTDAKMLAASKKLAEALNALLEYETEIQGEDWMQKQPIYGSAREALLAAGYLPEGK